MSVRVNDAQAVSWRSDINVDRNALVGMIAEMGGLAERQIVEAVDALSRGDTSHSKRVILADAALDAFHCEIHQKLIAAYRVRTSIAIDAREMVGIVRIANDLERIGDRAKNIAKRVIGIDSQQVPRKAIRGVRHMAALVLQQLQGALDSFAMRDSSKAFQVWNCDEEIDTMNTSLFCEVLDYMNEDLGNIAFGVHLLFCAKNIERMGDHITNIAEAVYFIVEGRVLLDERPKADATSVLSRAATF